MGVGTIPDASFDRVGSVLLRALDGLTLQQLKAQPAGTDSNPIGWIAFHLTRVHDRTFSLLLGKVQAFVEGGFHELFGLPADTGTLSGNTLDEVREFNPNSAELLSSYWTAARGHSHKFLEGLTETDIETPTPPGVGPASPPETYRLTVARVTSDTSQHIGQIAYARGLVDRHGWYGA